MILTCPNCGTQYVVKDGAIPHEGRQVRCAACKHSWHQQPDAEVVPSEGEPQSSAPAPAEEDVQAIATAPDEAETLVEATMIEPRSGPEAEERAYEEAVIDGDAEDPAAVSGFAPPDEVRGTDETAQAQAESELPADNISLDDFTPFADDEKAEARKRRPLTTLLIAALAVVVIAALFWFLAPSDLKAKLGIASAGATPLQLVTTHMDRQQLESGNQLLTVTGRVINPTDKEQDVPPIQAQLRSKAGKVVYRWTIAPPARSLAGGASASFNSAEVNVPPGGDELTITLGQSTD